MTRDIEKQRGKTEKALKVARRTMKIALWFAWSILAAGVLLILAFLVGLVAVTGFPSPSEPRLYVLAFSGLLHAGFWYGMIRLLRWVGRRRIARHEAELDALGERPEADTSG